MLTSYKTCFKYVLYDTRPAALSYEEQSFLKEAFDLYPDGFPNEVAAKKGSRRPTEIVLFPADRLFFNGEPSGMGGGFHGEHVYDYSAAKVDRIYCTGFGSPHEYSHERGHMVVSSARIVNGWSASCSQWAPFSAGSGSEGFASSYAVVSRPEPFAEPGPICGITATGWTPC